MYLPSDKGKWKVLERSQATVAIKELNDYVKTVRDIDSFLELISLWQLFFQTRIKSSFNTSSQTKLLVECVHYRELSFYPGKKLYRFSCVIDQIKELAGYERLAYLFAIGPIDLKSSGESNWLLLDWASATIFLLNEQAEPKIRDLSCEQIRDYLIFFCNFRGSDMDEDNTIAPFLIPPTIEDFGWEDTLSTLEEVAEKRHWQTFPLNSASDFSTADNPDLPEKKRKSETDWRLYRNRPQC